MIVSILLTVNVVWSGLIIIGAVDLNPEENGDAHDNGIFGPCALFLLIGLFVAFNVSVISFVSWSDFWVLFSLFAASVIPVTGGLSAATLPLTIATLFPTGGMWVAYSLEVWRDDVSKRKDRRRRSAYANQLGPQGPYGTERR